ncbi:MAG: hypothetical protein GY928_24055 [Colwellia sp.]|nr:hypothetical protein [Colwellia sp.]
MGTATKELQEKIKDQLNRLDWSVKRLARELYYHNNDAADEETDKGEVKRAEERLKKQLQRSGTPEKKLEELLNTIPKLDLFRKTNLVSPRYIASDEVSADFKRAMKDLSEELTNELEG